MNDVFQRNNTVLRDGRILAIIKDGVMTWLNPNMSDADLRALSTFIEIRKVTQ